MSSKSNKNQTAQARKAQTAAESSQPLREPRTCSECGTKITMRGDLHMVQVSVGGGKAKMQARCPQHKVTVAAGGK